ncbi:hypothetical protein [Brevundimonas sp. R86498]|uniref:hypothetical protein n=1 Tax=Brevundimonas sp. R86498 TaxID=3093845 RepID=UPI0037C94B9B
MWGRRSGRRQSDSPSAVATVADVWERAGQAATATPPVMTEVEALALTIYGLHGLPTVPGHYRRGPGNDAWAYLGEHVGADIRWAMVLERPPEAGWRYATLEDIGRFPGAPADLRAASHLLGTCRRLKARLTGREPGHPADDLETAIRLGADWHALTEALAQRGKSRLKLTPPSDAETRDSSAPEALAPPQAKAVAVPKPKRVRRPKAT